MQIIGVSLRPVTTGMGRVKAFVRDYELKTTSHQSSRSSSVSSASSSTSDSPWAKPPPASPARFIPPLTHAPAPTTSPIRLSDPITPVSNSTVYAAPPTVPHSHFSRSSRTPNDVVVLHDFAPLPTNLSLSIPSVTSAPSSLTLISSTPDHVIPPYVIPAAKDVPPPRSPGDPPHYHPIPSSEVFSPSAPTLFLPALDSLLSRIPAPVFTSFPGPEPSMFPALDQLSKGRSLADMMYNTRIPPVWKSRSSIFSFVCSFPYLAPGSPLIELEHTAHKYRGRARSE